MTESVSQLDCNLKNMARSRKSTKGPTKASKASSSSTRPPQDTHLNEAESFNKKKKQQAVHVETTIEKRHEKCWAQNHLLEKRRYFLLFGTFLGMLSMLIFHHGGLNEEILPIPSEMVCYCTKKTTISNF
jgi:hypothetical protein